MADSPTNTLQSRRDSHPGITLRLSRCSVGAIAALVLSAGFAPMNNAGAQNGNTVAPVRAGSEGAAGAAAIKALPIIKYHYAMAQQLAKLKGVTS